MSIRGWLIWFNSVGQVPKKVWYGESKSDVYWGGVLFTLFVGCLPGTNWAQVECNRTVGPVEQERDGVATLSEHCLKSEYAAYDLIVNKADSDPYEYIFSVPDMLGSADRSSVSWEFGDGSADSGISVRHKFDGPGEYDVVAVLNFNSVQKSQTVAETVNIPTAVKMEVVESPILIDGQKDVVIENKIFRGDAFRGKGDPAIYIKGGSSNITVRNCLFQDVDWAIRIRGGHDVTIRGNRFDHVGVGVRGDDMTGGFKVEYNEGYYLSAWDIVPAFKGYWGGGFAHAVNSTGKGNSISYNVFDNRGVPAVYLEDMTNLWNSGGTPDSYFRIIGNKYRGSSIPNNVSRTGGGIVVGDGLGSDGKHGWYITIQDNIMVRTQSYGIGGAGGHFIEFINNIVHMPADHTSILTPHPYHPGNGGGAGIIFTKYSGNPCGDLWFEGNDSYAIGWTADFSESYLYSWSRAERVCDNVHESGNTWRSEPRPGIEKLLAEDMFKDLKPPYFSAVNGGAF